MIRVLNKETNYWLVRTASGNFYDEFVAENYIAIGWNEINDLDLIREAQKDTNKQEELLAKIKELKDEEGKPVSQPGRIYSPIHRFVNEIKVGDIVLIPSKDSFLIEFGIVESDVYLCDKKFFNVEDGECDFLKRRKVRWVHRQKRNDLDPYLYRLLNSHHTISNANEYAPYIDRTLNSFYVKDGKAHFVLDVRKESEIYGSELIKLINLNLDLVDYFNEVTGSNLDKGQIQIKINVQSPGHIELIGPVLTIFAIGAVYCGLFGGKVKILPLLSFETEGIVEKVKQFLEQHNKYKLENRKLDLQEALLRLNVKVPSELQIDIVENPDQQNGEGSGI